MADKSEKVRRQIIETANRLFYHKGYNQTSFSDIADAAHVPRGNFYYYFKAKDDILRAVIAQRVGDIRGMLAEWDENIGTPVLRLQRFVEMLRNEQQDLVRYGCPMGSLNTELGKAQPALKREARAMFDLYRGWLARQFEVLGFQEQAESLAVELLSRAQGIAVMSQVYGDKAILAQQTVQLDAWIGELVERSEDRRA